MYSLFLSTKKVTNVIIIKVKLNRFSHILNVIISKEMDSPTDKLTNTKDRMKINVTLSLKSDYFDFWFATFFPSKQTTVTKWGLELGYIQGH